MRKGKGTRLVMALVLGALALPSAAWNNVLFDRMPEDAVLVDIDGTVLLKKDVASEEALWKSLYGKLGNNREAQIGKRPNIVSRFERETILAHQAEREKVFASPSRVKKAVLDIAHRSGNKKEKYASSFLYRMGEDGKWLEKLVHRRIVVEALERTVREAVPAVTDEELAKEKSDRAVFNTRAKTLLAQSWTSASNLWNRITVSNDFDACVAEYEEERDHIHGDPEWGSFTIDFFDDNAHLQKCLRAAKAGDVLPLMPADNGLMIIKVVGIDHDETAATSKEATRYRLASIFIALPYFHPALTDEQLRAAMLEDRQDAAWKAKVAAAKDAAKIVYPCGREVFDTRTPLRRRSGLRKSAARTPPRQGEASAARTPPRRGEASAARTPPRQGEASARMDAFETNASINQ